MALDRLFTLGHHVKCVQNGFPQACPKRNSQFQHFSPSWQRYFAAVGGGSNDAILSCSFLACLLAHVR